MSRCLLAFTHILTISVVAFGQNECQTDRLNAVKTGEQRIRGTNFGSWFIQETGMVGYLWDDNGCDTATQKGTYFLEKCLGDRAGDVMEEHWSTFITEEDFVKLSALGVNAIRVPIGWWQIYDTEGGVANASLNYDIQPRDFLAGALKHFDKAFDWGTKYGIGIIVDIHAATGSQNGVEHSSPTDVSGQPHFDKNPDNVDQTIESLRLYAERYASKPSLLGFALLNEPGTLNTTIMQDYYQRAYATIREISEDSWIIISPRNSPYEYGTEPYWTSIMNPEQGYEKVAMDLHFYSCFGGNADQSNADGAIDYIRNDRRQQIQDFIEQNPKKLFIGEWSACGHFSIDRAGDFTQAEVEVYGEATLGWTWWSWIDPHEVWSMQNAFEQEWLQPQVPC